MSINPANNQGLVFIPDISGFTKFINRNEIEHSHHIISELLELIIDANQLGMEVNEIEGDAVLFYRQAPLPSIDEINIQVESMFTAFHEHLMLYERDRICQCGACSTANDLSLKVFVHAGNIQTVNIKEHKKLLGKDVILSHRVLKNSIAGSQYLLYTENYLISQNENIDSFDHNWAIWKQGSDIYDEIGEVKYAYTDLEFLLAKVRLKPREKISTRSGNKLTVSIDIDAPVNEVHFALTDLEVKKKISDDIKEVSYDKSKIPQVGTIHQCVLPSGNLEIEATENKVDKDVWLYAEKVHNFPIFRKANFVYSMKKIKDRTKFNIDLYIPEKGIIQRMKFLLFQFLLRRQVKKNANALKQFVETPM